MTTTSSAPPTGPPAKHTFADRPTRKQMRHDRTRREILAAGRALLASGRDLSLRRMADDIGMTGPAIYRYFDSFAALEAVLVDALTEELQRDIAAARERTVDPLAVDAVVRSWQIEHPAELRLLLTAAGAPALAAMLHELHAAHDALYGDDAAAPGGAR